MSAHNEKVPFSISTSGLASTATAVGITAIFFGLSWLICLLPAVEVLRTQAPGHRHLRREATLAFLVPMSAGLLLLTTAQDASGSVLTLLLAPSIAFLIAGAFWDALTMRLPNVLLALAAAPLAVLHALRTYTMLGQARDSCFNAWDYWECAQSPHMHELTATDHLDACWPWLLAMGLGLFMWLIAATTHGLGMGDVKLVPILVLLTGFTHWWVSLVAIAGGMLVGSLGILYRCTRSGATQAAYPLGPWLIGTALATHLLLHPVTA